MAQGKNNSRGGLLSEMAVWLLITYAAGCSCFERRLPDRLSLIYSGVMITACIAVWLLASFSNGRRGKWGILVFSAAAWILPQVIMLVTNEELHGARKNTVSFALSEFCGIFSTAILERVFGRLSENMLINAAAAAAVCAAVYSCGYITAERKRRKGFKRNTGAEENE